MTSDEIEPVIRPLVDDFDDVDEYEQTYAEHIRYKAEAKDYPPHQEQDYPLVLECPLCGGVASVAMLSPIEEPRWRCRGGGHSYADSWLLADDVNVDLQTGDE